MFAVLPGHALAGWMDNVPSRFIPQTHRTPLRPVEAPDVGLTTGSITGMPRRPSTGRHGRPETSNATGRPDLSRRASLAREAECA
jgi:hypothetical protein